MINEAYKKLLAKSSQSLPVPPQMLCQFSNISECLPIEGQDRVSTIRAFILTMDQSML